MRSPLLLLALIVLTLAAAAPASAAGWQGSFNASYQAATVGETIVVPAGSYGDQRINARAALRGGACSLSDTTKCVNFVMGGNVQINGSIEVHGAAVHIDGGNKLRVSGYVDTEADTASQYPDHVMFENLQTGNIGAFSSTDITFKNLDVGPSTVGSGCSRPENKIGYGSGIVVEPTNIVLDGLYIHNQNVDSAGRASGCHYGGLFIVTAENLVIKNSVFERNVVYHVQIQNFSGPPAKNVVFDNNRFGCPVEWLDVGDVCDGQRAIQFDYDPGTQFTLSNNVAANGTDGLYGCYVGTCGGLTGLKLSNNINLAASTTAPGSAPPPPPPPVACADGIDNDGDGKIDLADPGCSSATDTDETDSAPPPPTCVGQTLPLTKIAETATTVTFQWAPPAGVEWYTFWMDGKRVSNGPALLADGTTRTTVRFAKLTAGCYRVDALGVIASGGSPSG